MDRHYCQANKHLFTSCILDTAKTQITVPSIVNNLKSRIRIFCKILSVIMENTRQQNANSPVRVLAENSNTTSNYMRQSNIAEESFPPKSKITFPKSKGVKWGEGISSGKTFCSNWRFSHLPLYPVTPSENSTKVH